MPRPIQMLLITLPSSWGRATSRQPGGTGDGGVGGRPLSSPCNLRRGRSSSRTKCRETLTVRFFSAARFISLALPAASVVVLHWPVVFGPVAVTAYIAWWAIDTVDNWVRPWFPPSLSPDGYLPFHIPGFGVVIAIVGLTCSDS